MPLRCSPADFIEVFAPVTDAALTRARADPAFRQKLLSQNLDALLIGLQKLRSTTPASRAKATAAAKQIREGVELAVRLAELIQINAERGR